MRVAQKFRSLIPPRLETQDHIRQTSDPSPTQQLDNGVFVNLKTSSMLLFFFLTDLSVFAGPAVLIMCWSMWQQLPLKHFALS